jgi:hypothetical protein
LLLLRLLDQAGGTVSSRRAAVSNYSSNSVTILRQHSSSRSHSRALVNCYFCCSVADKSHGVAAVAACCRTCCSCCCCWWCWHKA